MKLLDLLNEMYEFLGDSIYTQREFQALHLLDLVNEGCREFRRLAEERWNRTDIALVATTAVYPQPAQSVRLERVAYDDKTIEPTTVQGLQAIDDRWGARSASEPTHWTTEGIAHNQFRVYPTPEISTPDLVVFAGDPNVAGWSGELGKIGRWVEQGVNDTFIADPNVGGWSAERGIVRRKTNAEMTADTGVVRTLTHTGADHLTVWYVERPGVVTAEDDEVPVKRCYQRAVMWYALAQVYGEEGDRYNPAMRKYCESFFLDYVNRATLLMAEPLAFQIDKLRPARSDPLGPALGWPSSIVDQDGNTQTVHWPRRSFWT